MNRDWFTLSIVWPAASHGRTAQQFTSAWIFVGPGAPLSAPLMAWATLGGE